MREVVGKRVGDYEILSVLGAGGMGQVFKVRNVLSDRIEAMKILLPDLVGHQGVADRFLREIKVLAALNHPNIAGLRTALTLENQLVMIMEYVEGATVATLILTKGPIATREAENYTDQVLSALSYAHQQNVIHRDIKPSNMMLTPQGAIKLLDFGIARYGNDQALTMTGTTLGSLYYMSPEQVKGEPTDGRSDLYSLGVSLYEMVTGVRPFRSSSDYSVMAAHIQEQPTPPIALRSDLPPGLNEFIMTAMAKDPRQRFQSADAARRALSRVGTATPQIPSAQAIPRGPSAPLSATSVFESSPGDGSMEPMLSPPLHSRSAPAQNQQQISVTEMSLNKKFRRGFYMAMGGLVVVAGLIAAAFFPRGTKAVTLVSIEITPARITATTGTSANFLAIGAYNDGTRRDVTLQSTWTSSNPGIATLVSPVQNPELANCLSAGSGTVSAAMGSISSTAGLTCMTPPVATPPPLPVDGEGSEANSSSGGQAKGPGLGGIINRDFSPKNEPEPNVKTPAAEPSDRSKQLRKQEDELDQLFSRANSINDSLDNLRRRQSTERYGLRPDMASAQEMMKTSLTKAQSALQARDVDNAERYLIEADTQANKLERFLGR